MMDRPSGLKYWLGDVVFLRCRDDKIRGMITQVVYSSGGGVTYCIAWGNATESYHSSNELSKSFVPEWESVDE